MRRILLIAVLSSGCAHGMRVNGGPVLVPGECRTFTVPFYWTDGSVTAMTLTSCVTERR